MYNMTLVENAPTYYDKLISLNNLSGGIIGPFMLFSLFIVLFASFKYYEQDTKEVLLFTSIITTIVGVMFWSIELIAWHIMIYPLVMVIISIILYNMSD